MNFATIGTTEKTTTIGFVAEDEVYTDDYFDKFRYSNQENIIENGLHHFILKDGTYIKKIYNPSYVNQLYKFDQYILADNSNGFMSKLRQSYLLKNIRWSNKIPEEYRIIYLDIGSEIHF